MEIYYQGIDVTSMVNPVKCVVRDTAGGRCDSLEITFSDAAGWYGWGPEEDDKIIVTDSGYYSGLMYVNKVIPENGNYRILAASLPCAARKKTCQSFVGQTLENIMRSCAAVSGMDYQMFGVSKTTVIPYIEQEDESCAAFLDRLLMFEGAVLKCVNGKYTAIGIEYAQNLDILQKLTVYASQEGCRYRRDGTTLRGVRIKSPYVSAYAEDTLVNATHPVVTLSDLPVRNNIQAARWARGKLMHINRNCESVTIQSEFNPGLTSMMRIDISGDTDATGEWLTEDVEHDFVSKTTTATLRRCVRTIR